MNGILLTVIKVSNVLHAIKTFIIHEAVLSNSLREIVQLSCVQHVPLILQKAE